MGLLDDLRSEADRIRASGEQRQTVEAQREAFYQQAIRPAMLRIFEYLNDLLAQLRVVQPDVVCEFRIPGSPRPFTARQALPTLNIDSSRRIGSIAWRTSFAAKDVAFSVQPIADAEETRAFLFQRRYVFTDIPRRGQRGELVGLHFVLPEIAIHAGVEIAADIENRCLRMQSSNIEGFAQHRDTIQPGQVDDDWLDRLGRYLLGQGPSPARQTLTDEQRAALQDSLAREVAERERAIAEGEQLLQALDERESLTSRVKRLLETARQRVNERARE